MFNELAFSITRNRKPKTKNSRTLDKNTKPDWVFLKEPYKKLGEFHVLRQSKFFEKTFDKM